MDSIETAKYLITGLVDKFDEQMNITGQYEVGSIQEFPVEVGTKLVAEGQAEAVGEEEGGDDTTTDPETMPGEEAEATDAELLFNEEVEHGEVTVDDGPNPSTVE